MKRPLLLLSPVVVWAPKNLGFGVGAPTCFLVPNYGPFKGFGPYSAQRYMVVSLHTGTPLDQKYAIILFMVIPKAVYTLILLNHKPKTIHKPYISPTYPYVTMITPLEATPQDPRIKGPY